MAIPVEVRWKFYALRSLAAVLLVFAAVLYILAPHNFTIRSLCLLALFTSVGIVRRSNVSVWLARGQIVPVWSFANEVKQIGPLLWTFTAVSLVACVICYFLLHRDALHGGKDAWPVYAFAVTGLVFGVTVAYVASQIFRRLW